MYTYQLEAPVYDGGVSADSTLQRLSINRQRALRVAQGVPAGYEMSQRGQVYRACSAIAGIAPGTALGTSAQALCIFNPPGSGVNASLIELAWAYVSGTFAMGNFVLANYSMLNPTTNVAPGGTACTTSRADGTVNEGKIKVYSAATCTAAPILCEVLDWFGVVDGTGATQVGAVRKFARDGSDVISPGSALFMTYVSLAGGAGTTPKAAFSAKWAELPILSAA